MPSAAELCPLRMLDSMLVAVLGVIDEPDDRVTLVASLLSETCSLLYAQSVCSVHGLSTAAVTWPCWSVRALQGPQAIAIWGTRVEPQHVGARNFSETNA